MYLNMVVLNSHVQINNQHYFFKENRHDQSIWSMLRKKYGSIVIDTDETNEFTQIHHENHTTYDWNTEEKFKYPFWATRLKF